MATKKTVDESAEVTRRTTRRRTTAEKKVEKRDDKTLESLPVQIGGVVSNIEMLFNTIQDLRKRDRFEQIERLNVAQEENFARLRALDEKLEVEMRKKYQTDERGLVSAKRSASAEVVRVIDQTDEFLQAFNNSQKDDEEVVETIKTKVADMDSFKEMTIDDIDEIYDVLNLPSEGQCYPHKKNKIAVSYLTATDENFITSPNLYRDGLITDCLLHRKVVDKTFDVDNLVSGDADAVLYFLRVSSYGADFPATFTDPETNTEFETIIDLSQIKTKEFKLKGDENGYFDFELPVSKDKVKFKFLTKKDERKLNRLNQLGNNSSRAVELRSIIKYLDSFLDDGTVELSDDERYHIEDGVNAMNDVADRISEEEGLPVNKLITNRLEMTIMSINGNEDRNFIKKYVQNMIAKDSLSLRRYMLENEPGLDFSVKIEKPESLGGGFIDTFLEWGDTIFLSIA